MPTDAQSPSTPARRKCKTAKCHNTVTRGHKYCPECRRKNAAQARKYRRSSSRKAMRFAHSIPSGELSLSFSNPAPAGVGVNSDFYRDNPIQLRNKTEGHS